MDEVGRGPLAGPVVAAAVIFAEKLVRFRTQRYKKRFQNPNTRKSMRLCPKTPLRWNRRQGQSSD